MAVKRKRPVLVTRAAREMDRAGRPIYPEVNRSHLDRQASRIVTWLHISQPVARVVAALHFGEAGT
jgi:hypothetical protein